MTQDKSETGLSKPASAGVLAGMLVLCFAIAAVGGLSTGPAITSWYPTLDKPPWTPPNWVFGPMWTTLYIGIAFAGWDLIRKGASNHKSAMVLFGVQLVLNALWSPVFFGLKATGPALAVIVALWFVIVACVRTFWGPSKLASLVMVPYLIWISIATSLNAWIWWFSA